MTEQLECALLTSVGLVHVTSVGILMLGVWYLITLVHSLVQLVVTQPDDARPTP